MFRRDLRHTAKYVAITNTPPIISAISNQTNNQNITVGPLAFTVSDAETPGANLVVSGVSSNVTLVPNSALIFSGTNGNRFLTFTPATSQSGTTFITLTVTDDEASLAVLARDLLSAPDVKADHDGSYAAPRTTAFLAQLATKNGGVRHLFHGPPLSSA